MTIQHVDITDPYIHEPKDISTAAGDTVYVADGAGGGAWQLLAAASLNDETELYPGIEAAILADTIETHPAEVMLQAVIADVSTAETVYIAVPAGLTVREVSTVLEGAITVADATITVANNAGSSMGTIVVAFTGSGAGDVDTLTPASNNVIAAGEKISVATDGGSTDAQRLWVTLHCTMDAHYA